MYLHRQEECGTLKKWIQYVVLDIHFPKKVRKQAMLDAYKELTPVVYGENAIKYLKSRVVGSNRLCFYMHWHERMELIRVMEGSLELNLGEEYKKVVAGQVAIFVPGQLHCGFSGEKGVQYHTLMFDVEKFSNATIASNKYLEPVYKYGTGFETVTGHPRVVEAVDRLISFVDDKEENNPLFAVGAVYELMGCLHQYCAGKTRLIHKPDESFSAVLEYINTNFAQKISAKDVSEKFGYNETYFCRRFKSVTGITMMQYIQALRMEQAQKLLKSSREEIGNIAWKCGYSDVSYFSNCFKKHFGYTPTEFRNSND